jgi:hypothetical protein
VKKCLAILISYLFATGAGATVRVFVQDTNGLAAIKYQCTAGEVVRAFALNVTVDNGVILGISNFLRGPGTPLASGYGIFPAAFRDYVTVSSGTNADFTSVNYTPLATVADSPADTLPGLNSSGITLEFAALWDPAAPALAPPSIGTLCLIQISRRANVTISANTSRGGLVAAPSDLSLASQFIAAEVDPEIAILQATITNSVMFILFKGGELESAPALTGPWTGTGNTNGTFTEPVAATGNRFYRVHRAGATQ